MLNRKRSSVVRACLVLGVGVLSGAGAVLAAPTEIAPKADDRDIVYRTGPDGRVIAVVRANVPDSPAFGRFSKWLEKYSAASAEARPKLEAEGVRLATERRTAMVEMISRDPKRALELAVYPAQRAGLPVAVTEQLETFVQGRGSYSVLHGGGERTIPVEGKPGQTKKVLYEISLHKLFFDGQSYEVHTYGQREGLMTKDNLPFYGIALDGHLAIHESPLRVLAKGEAIPQGATPGKDGTKCPICKADAANGTVGVVGNTVYYFDSEKHVQEFTEKLWALEYEVGPDAHG